MDAYVVPPYFKFLGGTTTWVFLEATKQLRKLMI